MNARSSRWGGLAGIAAMAAFIASSVLLRHSPSTDQPTRDITAWFTDHRTTALTATYLLGLGATILLVFLGALRHLLRRDDDLDAAASVAFAGGVGLAITTLLEGAMVAVLAFRPDTTPAVARALYDTNGLLVAFAAFPAAALVSASSVVALRSRVLPRWLGWAGLAVAALELVGAASFQQSGSFMPQGDAGALQAAVGGFMLWLLATSLVMVRASAVRTTGHAPVAKPEGAKAA